MGGVSFDVNLYFHDGDSLERKIYENHLMGGSIIVSQGHR